MCEKTAAQKPRETEGFEGKFWEWKVWPHHNSFSFFFSHFTIWAGPSFSPVCLIQAGSEAADILILIFSFVKRYLGLTETEYIVK